MRTGLLRVLATALVLVASAALGDADAAAAPSAIERLEAALRARPNDAALARALARAQLGAGLPDAALATLDDQSLRAPEQRAALAQLRGRVLYARGDLALARGALREAVAYRGTDALAYLYLGLTEHRLGARAAAAEALARAQQLDPRLAERVLAVTLAPASGWRRFGERISLSGQSALEYDTNATLEGDESTAAIPGGPSDGRLAFQGGISARVLERDEAALSLSYRFNENHDLEHEALDVQSHAASLSGALALAPRWQLRLESGAARLRLDGARYLQTASVASGFAWRSESRGTFELRGFGERRAYEDEAPLSSLERDGWRTGASLRHALGFRLGAPAQLATQLSYARTLTEGSRDDDGFGPAFDSHFSGIDTALRVALPRGLRADARLAFALEQFDERNVIDYLSGSSSTPDQAVRRRDHIVDASLGLARALGPWLELELRVRETRHFSNVTLYDWDRQIVGTTLRFHWQPVASRRKP